MNRLEQDLADIRRVNGKLTDDVHKIEIAMAKQTATLENVAKNTEKISGNLNKIALVVITAVIGGFIAFMAKGGLVIG